MTNDVFLSVAVALADVSIFGFATTLEPIVGAVDI